MKVSVITPNYNGEKFLKKYFKALNEDSEYIGEVIIIDNGSSDGSLKLIENIPVSYPVHIIENTENLGFAKAVNQAVQIAEYDYVLSLNNDTEIWSDSIGEMLKLIEDSDVFSVQAMMLKYNNLIDDAGDEYNILGWSKKTGENNKPEKYNISREIFSSCAGAALYDKAILLELGCFDGRFFAYMEDIDLALRAQINGYRNLYCPKAVVYHVGSATSGSRYNEFKVRLAARNNVWTIYKNIPIPLKIINFIFIFLGFFIKYLFFFKKGFSRVYLEGVREGLNQKSEIEKVKFKRKNLKNYISLEYKLIVNMFKFIKK